MKTILQLDLEGNLIKEWSHAKAAEIEGFNNSHITGCCRGRAKTHKGFKWEYKNAEDRLDEASMEELRIKNNENQSIKMQKQNHKDKRNKCVRERYRTDTNYRTLILLRRRMLHALEGNLKCASTKKLLGCSLDFLKDHLESKFTEGMNWENQGDWHIDHIKPCCKFNLEDEEEQHKCFHWSNLQPLWGPDNIAKGGK